LENGMAIKRIEHRASFTARSDDGTEYYMHYFVQIIDAGNSSDPNAEIDGLGTLRTGTGESVNFIGKKRYLILTNAGETVQVTSTDPMAP
jgi:hypothetical protein